ncbi:phospholipase [Verticiella sediminum]|uniref:Phospholipase A1 n=1 Tax=Verticiella sediminum TaxID=1247510 RepID=A0A556A7N3_9BURK|nr:phospholipase A [Verticiella sediminum]TSH88885.1 phospholipase [Verticiella sediminum]
MFPYAPAAVAAAVLAMASAAQAATTYQLDRTQASSGEAIEIRGTFFNDGTTAATWQPPRQLVLQWRDREGRAQRTVAHAAGEVVPATVPVNNFVRMVWRTVVPAGLTGLQAIAIEGEPGLLALDTSTRERSAIAGTPAVAPVTDPSAAQRGEPVVVPPIAAAQMGVDPNVGAAPVTAPQQGRVDYAANAWESFRNALSPYEPVYFVVGTRGGTNARFQISMKYRLFQPPVDRPSAFYQNFYLGYTQTSLWDLDSPSKPFYDTTYNPSVFWMSESLWQSASQRFSAGLATGVDHQSNGRDGDDSRSMNSAYVQPILAYRLGNGSTFSFTPKIRQYFSIASENPDIRDYRGRVDWRARWTTDDGMMISGMWRDGKDGKDSWQADFAYPLKRTWFSGLNGFLHLQYVNGYGQSLLDYNVRQPDQFRIGLMLVH